MRERLRAATTDSESTYYRTLLYTGELILKLTTAALLAGLRQDPDDHQYRLEHRLVKADSLGDWAEVLDEALVGTASRFLQPQVRGLRRQLTETAVPNDWRARVVQLVERALLVFEPRHSGVIRRPQLRQWARPFVTIRNKTRGHGAPLTAKEAEAIPYLAEAVGLLGDNLDVLGLSWAYVKRRMTGRAYQVVPLREGDHPFRALLTATDALLDDGLYLDLGYPAHVRLVFTEPELRDMWVANGAFADGTFEVLSYATGDTLRVSGARYDRPPAPLPRSETHGTTDAVIRGSVFTNMPSPPAGFVPRPALEAELEALLRDEYHRLLTLSGRGGIGKTSLALAVLDRLADESRFDGIWWFSARDIDLLPEGVRPVRQGIVGAADIAMSHWELTRSPGTPPPKADVLLGAFLSALAHQAGDTCELFVFDNFETVAEPAELYRWVERAVRDPNKVLITTRERRFKGDYAVEVGGMTEDEFSTLLRGAARQLGVEGLITDRFVEDAFRESDGHPYVAKILVGEVRRLGKTGSVPRILADKGEILDALFERTYSRALSPIAQRLFLTLSAWRSSIPEVAVKAALLRPANERIDVDAALDELIMSSMLEAIDDPDGERWFIVPGSAQLFGQAKLGTSPDRAAILSDVAVLQAFGAAQDSDVRRGIPPRVDNLVRWAIQQIEARGEETEALAILEYVASRFPPAWLSVADLRRRLRQPDEELHATRRFVDAQPREADGWRRLLTLYRQSGEAPAEMEATVQLVALTNTPYREISGAAARFSQLTRDGALTDAAGRAITAERLRTLMESRLSEADATDLSRIGWICVQMKDYERAVELGRRGLVMDPGNVHCRRLADLRW